MLRHVEVCRRLLLRAYVICVISSIDGNISIFHVEIYMEGIPMLSCTHTHICVCVSGHIT